MAANQDLEQTRSVIETQDEMEKESFITIGVNFSHPFFCMMMRSVLMIVYGRRGKSMPPIDDPLLLDSAVSLAEKIRTKQVKATEVMHAFIRRIKQINPLLNCVVDERYKEALEEAAEVDRLIASNKFTVDELKETKPFLGVPISNKDPIGVKGMKHSAGLWQRRNERCTKDADVIHLMREAGAIPFVTTNIPELCMGWESYNKIFGRSLNPYDTARIVGGSSGGEACLQAAAGSPFGLGSDIGGSIRMPAFFNGIFGHMPSPLIVSIEGHFPDCTSKEEIFASRIGPLCRFACDLKPTLKIIAGDKAKELDLDKPVDLSSLKCFYQYDDGGASFVSTVDNDIRIGLEKVVEHFENVLNIKPQQVKIAKFKDSVLLWAGNVIDERVGVFECKLANFNGQLNPYTELLKWFMGLSKHTLYALMTAIRIRWSIKYGTPEHRLKMDKCAEFRREFDEMLGDSGVFLYPTQPTVAPYHTEPIIKDFNFSYSGIFNVLGLPSTACPLGLGKEGLPIGIQVVANRNQDRLCLAVASELERTFGGWVAPDINV